MKTFKTLIALAALFAAAEACFAEIDVTAVPGDPGAAAANVAAFQRAIDAAAAARGGVVFVPAGTYYIDGTIQLRGSVSLRGESIAASRIVCAGKDSSYPALRLGTGEPGEAWGSNGNLYIQDLAIVGNREGVSMGEGDGIQLNHAAYVRIVRVQVTGFTRSCIHARAIGYSSIEDCLLTNAGQDVVWFDSGLAWGAYDANAICTSTTVRDCQISSGFRSSVHVDSGSNIAIRGCQLEDSGYARRGAGCLDYCDAGALLVTGQWNKDIVFEGNYVEAIRSPYLICLRGACCYGMFIERNYFGKNPDNYGGAIQHGWFFLYPMSSYGPNTEL